MLQFDPSLLEETQNIISIALNVTSNGDESELFDNARQMNLSLERDFLLSIDSVSTPDQFHFNYTDDNTTDIVQQYDIQNLGPSSINLLIFILSIPTTETNQSHSIDISGTEIINVSISLLPNCCLYFSSF